MNNFMLLVILCLGLFSIQEAKSGENLRITTFNLKFYGIGAEQGGGFQDEYRDPWLHQFIEQNLSASEVIVFEEVVDVPRLEALLGESFRCLSYQNSDPKHQHVVLCHHQQFTFVPVEVKAPYTIDAVAFKHYRPAIWGKLVDPQGKNLAYLVGVHLKAKPEGHELRLQQAQVIGQYLATLQQDIPIIILGDFNTYGDDVSLISQLWAPLHLSHVPQEQLTYRYGSYASTFDHFWISDHHTQIQSISVDGPCNGPAQDELSLYNHNISDHCPLTLEVSLP
jgi:endonuclease/exonuclease/phosphatase family metal-dependent hydrolase